MRVLQTLLAFSGNAPPQLALTHQLVGAGHEVRVLAHEAARARVKRTGAEFVAFKRASPNLDMTRVETDVLRDWDVRTRIGAGLRVRDNLLFGLLLDTALDCEELLEQWPCEVMAFDWMLPGAALAAEATGLPAMALVHCPYPIPIPGAPPLGSALAPMGGRLGAGRDRLISAMVTRFFAPGLPALNRARSERGLEPLRDWYDQLRRVAEIDVLSAPELDYSSRGQLPANVRYVGPAFEPHDQPWRSPWPVSNTDPLVVISFSTSYMNQHAPVQRVLDAVEGLPVRALLTAGPALDPHALRVPANVRAERFVAHRSVFPHASLVITHAGWQTVNAALADGVPLVCVPGGRDQHDNALRVLDAGAGVRVRQSASPRKIRRVIAAALADERLEQGAKRMAQALGRSDGALRSAENLERLAGSSRTAR
ncbi:MAG TPA: glycosyltransferase [Solirubrobacteraceae bacterium]